MLERRLIRRVALGIGVAAVLAAIGAWVIPDMIATQGAVRAYTNLLSASFEGDIPRVKSLCSKRYNWTHDPVPAKEGGVVGLPRGINKNFRVWRQGGDVFLCPTNRVGPVYRFLKEDGSWKFDGVVGLLRAGGYIDRLSEDGGGMTEEEATAL